MSNRSVLVTAGGSGIGLAIAEIFHERGDRVIVCDVDQGALDRLGQNRPGIVTSLTDVADPLAVAAMIDRVGPVSVLVNNAGVAGPIGALEDNDPEDWARCFAVNVHGAFHMMRAVVPAMRAAKGGVIVNISTASTVTGLPGRSAYIASKWALEGLTKNAAREFGPAGIRVNAIRPGFMDTERMRGLMARASERRNLPVAEVEAEALGYISLRTKIQPSEIGEMAWFLASDTARHITAQIIGVDGNSEWEG